MNEASESVSLHRWQCKKDQVLACYRPETRSLSVFYYRGPFDWVVIFYQPHWNESHYYTTRLQLDKEEAKKCLQALHTLLDDPDDTIDRLLGRALPRKHWRHQAEYDRPRDKFMQSIEYCRELFSCRPTPNKT